MKKIENITVTSQVLKPLLVGALGSGLDIERLLKKCDINPHNLERSTVRIPARKIAKLVNYCCGLMKDETFGLLEKPIPIGYFRLVSLSMTHAETLHHALLRYIEFQNLQNNSFHYNLKSDDSLAELTIERIPGHHTADDIAVDVILISIHRFLAWLGNIEMIPRRVIVDYSLPTYLSELGFMYHGAPVLFDQGRVRLCFDHQDLECPVVQNEDSVESYFRRAPLDMFLPLDELGEVSQLVKIQLQGNLLNEEALSSLERLNLERLDFEKLATDMGYKSYQDLGRQLRSEGCSFHSIKARVRRDVAIYLLGYDSMSIEAVAEKAGYTEPSGFIRAFKSWTGFTPLQFQKGME